MGYDLHITRKADWSDPDGPTISEAEWRQLIENDPELVLDTETKCGDWQFVSWRDDPGWLAFTGREIRSKYPSDALIAKMVSIADRLGAKVQGDDGEVYPEALAERATKKPTWWHRLFGVGG